MTEKTRKAILYIRQGLMAFAAMLAMAGVSHYGITGIELLLPCVFALCFIVYSKAEKLIAQRGIDKSKKDLFVCGVLGIITGIATVVGSHIDMEIRVFSSMGLLDIIYFIFLVPFFTEVFVLLFFSSDACAGMIDASGVKEADQKDEKKAVRKLFLFSMVVMVLCWLPYYLTYFPGGIGNDDFECARMCLGEIPWTNHHPVFFVLIMNIFIKLSGENLGVAFALMSFAQMLMLGATLSYAVCWLYRKNIKKGYVYTAVAFFAFHPIVAMYSIYITKDVMFACAIVLLVLYLADNFALTKTDITWKKWTVLGLISALAIITRNNGTLVIAVLCAYMLCFMKNYRKQVFITFAVVFILNGIYKGPVWNGLGIEKQSFVESASIPLSQIAYTIYTDGIIEGENRDYLERLMPFDKVKEEFLPGYTDSYKFSEYFNTELVDSSPADFMKVWFGLLPDNFGRYVEAYLMQTSGYWKYGVSNTVATEGVQENTLGLVGTDVIAAFSGISIRSLLQELVLVARKLPVLCLLSQMAVQAMAVLVLIIEFVRKDKKQYLCVMVPFVALWLSVMIATPAHCLFRYMCPVFFMWPVMVAWFFEKPEEE